MGVRRADGVARRGCGERMLVCAPRRAHDEEEDRKSTRLNSSHDQISYAVFCLKKKKKKKSEKSSPKRTHNSTSNDKPPATNSRSLRNKQSRPRSYVPAQVMHKKLHEHTLCELA